MSRYVDIECDAVTEVICRRAFTSRSDIQEFLDNIPTAGVVEVRHGYWKWERKIEPQAQNRMYCSVCDNECLSKGNYYVPSDWCPHCGAKMDAKEPNND